jgi:hypothetical protein
LNREGAEKAKKKPFCFFAFFGSSRFIIGRMRRGCTLLTVLLAACSGQINGGAVDSGPPDAAPEPDAPPPDSAPADASFDPQSLEETGLYADFASETLAPGVVEYTVNYELWADGATKRRFVQLPEGATIDTTDMNFWSLPNGTKLWKEFSRDGVRVETRLLWKQGPTDEDWFTMSFAWNEENDEALAAELGQEDALGTPHDIPRATDCKTCHDRQPGFALGFAALQLDHAEGDMNLAALIADERLSAPPAGTKAPIFPLPGDPELDQPALGYLHGNCGPCHNPNSDVFVDRTQIVWHLDVDSLATVGETTIFQSTVGVAPELPIGDEFTAVIEPGDADASAALERMSVRDPKEDSQVPMPPLATEQPDTEGGVALVRAWIESLEQ